MCPFPSINLLPLQFLSLVISFYSHFHIDLLLSSGVFAASVYAIRNYPQLFI
jgi:hypothetical protein